MAANIRLFVYKRKARWLLPGFEFSANQLIILIAGKQSVLVAVIAGFVFISEGTLFHNYGCAFTNRAHYFSGWATIDVVVL